jgi:hypothetical protein
MRDLTPDALQQLDRAVNLAERLGDRLTNIRAVLNQWKDIEITPEYEMAATLWTQIDEALGEVNDGSV